MNRHQFQFLRLVYFFIIFLDKTIESIRLEYKWINGQRRNYSEIQILERYDLEKNLHQCQEFIEMFYTEQTIEIDSIQYIEKHFPSVRIVPSNPRKKTQLMQTDRRIIGDDVLSSRPAQISSITGHILLSSPNEPRFPLDDIQIGSTWNIPMMNSLGIVEYKLNQIDIQKEFVQIEFEGALNMLSDALLTGQWKFHFEKGYTIQQHIISTSSIFSEHKFIQIINKTLLTYE